MTRADSASRVSTAPAGWRRPNSFSSLDEGIAGPDSIAYPLDLECGTARQHGAEVEAWIYDAAGRSSQPVRISLACPS
jgi:hypothetical protein